MPNIVDFSEILEENKSIQPLVEVIQSIMDLPDDGLTDSTVNTLKSLILGMTSVELKAEAVAEIHRSFDAEGYTKMQVLELVKTAKQEFNNYIEELKPTDNKRILLNTLFESLYEIFDAAAEKYHGYSIDLPIMLEDNAYEPTYAHQTDAAADLYAKEDMVIPAHSTSNFVKTGVHIQLPEGWMALILPRSSVGAKTTLRLSNSAGVIDESYRGEVCALYDNIGDADYKISAGDRIAQMLVMPSYRFKAKIVNSLEDSDRGQGGFGSTGK